MNDTKTPNLQQIPKLSKRKIRKSSQRQLKKALHGLHISKSLLLSTGARHIGQAFRAENDERVFSGRMSTHYKE